MITEQIDNVHPTTSSLESYFSRLDCPTPFLGEGTIKSFFTTPQGVVVEFTDGDIIAVRKEHLRPVVTEVVIQHTRTGSSAYAEFSDGTDGVVCRWFSDEITFTEGDFIGKTSGEISDLHYQKDMAYLTEGIYHAS